MAEVVRLKHVVIKGERLADGVLHLIHIRCTVRAHGAARAMTVEVCMVVIHARAREERNLTSCTLRKRVHVRIGRCCPHRVHVIRGRSAVVSEIDYYIFACGDIPVPRAAAFQRDIHARDALRKSTVQVAESPA